MLTDFFSPLCSNTESDLVNGGGDVNLNDERFNDAVVNGKRAIPKEIPLRVDLLLILKITSHRCYWFHRRRRWPQSAENRTWRLQFASRSRLEIGNRRWSALEVNFFNGNDEFRLSVAIKLKNYQKFVMYDLENLLVDMPRDYVAESALFHLPLLPLPTTGLLIDWPLFSANILIVSVEGFSSIFLGNLTL